MSEEKRPITVEDLNKIHYVEDVQLSPDGEWIAYVKVTPAPLEKSYNQNIWVVASDGDSNPIQLTYSNKDTQPRWSPDGKYLAFTSTRNKKGQIFILRMTQPGGEARQLTKKEHGAGNPAWSPDGTMIAFTAPMNAVEREREDNQEELAPPKSSIEKKHHDEMILEDETLRWDPRPVWRLPYRTGTRFVDDRYTQVYIVNAHDLEAKPRRLTDVDSHYAPPQWSADGEWLYTARAGDLEAQDSWLQMELRKLHVMDGAEKVFPDEARRVVLATTYGQVLPALSPDGRWVAFMRTAKEATDDFFYLTLMPIDEEGEWLDINVGIDRQAHWMKWAPNNTLVAGFASEGRLLPHEYNPETETWTQLFEDDLEVLSCSVGANGQLAMTVSTPQNPNEVYCRPAKGADIHRLTHVNQDFLDEVIVQDVHEIRIQSDDGVEIQGWYILPVGYEEGQTYPLALNIHGGPHAMWGIATRSMWHEWQLHAAHGYAVYYSNPRGGDGYGAEFKRAIHNDWGDVAMRDVMAGVDWMIGQGYADESKLAITGGSYGGYLTTWIVGHTGRFASAVTQRGVYNLSSFYGTSDVPILISNEFDGEPWEQNDHLWHHSPLGHAHKITTPLLIMHAENDYRVPIEQAEQLFAFVHRSTDTPVKMLRYPRDGHEMSRSGEPHHRISRLTEMLAWWDEYCLGVEEAL